MDTFLPLLQPILLQRPPAVPSLREPGAPLQFLKRHPQDAARALLSGLLNSMSGFLLTIGIGEYFVLHYGSAGSKGRLLHSLGIHIPTEPVFFLVMTGIILVKAAALYFEKRNRQLLAETWVKDWREYLFSRQLLMAADEFLNKPYGQYLLRYSNDMKSIQQYLGKGVLGAASDGLFILTGLLVLSLYSGWVAVITLIGVLTGMILISTLVFRQVEAVRSSRNERSRLLAFVTKTFSRFRKIAESGTQQRYWEGFMERSDRLFTANIAQQKKLAAVEALSPILQYGTVIGVIAFSASGILSFSAGDLLVIIMILMLMQGAIRRLFQAPAAIMKGLLSVRKIRNS